MDGLLFDPTEYTDESVRRIMEGHTCRQCGNRRRICQGKNQHVRVSVCSVRKSGRTKSGFLRVRVDQPACILFTY